MATDEEAKSDKVQIKLGFRIPPRMPSVYAHHMLVQRGENEVVVSFFELLPPVFIEETPEERAESVQETGIIAECVARVTIAKNRFPDFAKAMTQVAAQIEKNQDKTESNDADNPENESKG